ncbi:MAG: PIN domain-containing protein [Archangium sp.]|nr:PIN domain-containing protein [Archangium sp.]
MRDLALDTNAVSALLEGDVALLELLDGITRFALPVIVVGEYRFGLQRSRHRKQLAAMLDELVAESDLLIVDDHTTLHYAQVREALRAKGRPLPENDVWIAALCRQHERTLVSRDGDFQHVAALTSLRW